MRSVLASAEELREVLLAALQMMYLKYQLPSEPNVYVDLLDDEDVSLMFDEVHISPPCCTRPST